MNLSPINPRLNKTKVTRQSKLSGKAFVFLIIFAIGLLWPNAAISPSYAQESPIAELKAQLLLDRLSPKERVGQLFLVTYPGIEINEESEIYDLIVNHNIGGVILLAGNDNFIDGQDALSNLLDMNRQLQTHRWNASQDQDRNNLSDNATNHFIPLFIGTDLEANDYPNEQMISGLTPLPNQMAIGATWNPDLAYEVGNILGQELSTLGFNLLINPSLDVLETPRPTTPSDLGTRTFGGDPYWVGEMGKAYVSGVHQGSNRKIAVVAKYFPGNGGADRMPDEEVATVRKPLEEIKDFDLAPFYAVTGNAPSEESTVEGLLTSHIRYQGFQENIRATTRPVSFDPQAFDQLMSLAPIAIWREAGGVMVSDNLGSKAVQRFFELTGQAYETRRVATNAFLAGNDLLYLGNIVNGDEPDQYEEIVRTLDFFAQKYQEDPAFAQRVDESAKRILTLKYKLYPTFNLDDILPPLNGISGIGQGEQITFDVAKEAATLISPSLAELADAIPDPPNQNDRLVFISDSRTTQHCSDCPEQTILDPAAFEQAVLRLYGPQAAGLALPYNLSAYSYAELNTMMDSDDPNTLQIENDLQRAHWVVFAMLNITDEEPLSLTLQRFLVERPDLIQGKRLIVFAYNAPYYLDATDISKVTTYYGLYSLAPSFIDVAARLLYRELQPSGSLPVSVPGVGYGLVSATSPNPDQVIPLFLDLPGQETSDPVANSDPLPTPEFRVDDLINVKTGTIFDHNGNPVPDNIPVDFIITIGGQISTLPQTEMTVNGVAQATIQVTTPGTLEIRVESEPAKQSDILRFDIPSVNGSIVTTTPTLEPTATFTPVPTTTSAPRLLLPTLDSQPPPTQPNIVDWFMATLIAMIIAFSAYRLAALNGLVRWGIRGGFLAFIGGVIAYSYLALNLPGSQDLLSSYGAWGVVMLAVTGSIIGLLTALAWRTIQIGTSG